MSGVSNPSLVSDVKHSQDDRIRVHSNALISLVFNSKLIANIQGHDSMVLRKYGSID